MWFFEPNTGEMMARFAESWGQDYNRNRLEAIRSMVFCNARQTNAVANADPDMLAYCPLHVTLTHKEGVTTVLFPRLSQVAAGGPAAQTMQALEDLVVSAIEEATR
jgi:hypothetical protein